MGGCFGRQSDLSVRETTKVNDSFTKPCPENTNSENPENAKPGTKSEGTNSGTKSENPENTNLSTNSRTNWPDPVNFWLPFGKLGQASPSSSSSDLLEPLSPTYVPRENTTKWEGPAPKFAFLEYLKDRDLSLH